MINTNRKQYSWIILLLLLITSCHRLQTIPYPDQTPESWCETHPCVTTSFLGHEFVFNEPSSSIIVYLLGLMTLLSASYLYKNKRNEKSRNWFSVALFFWGIAAISAGTSYQAFSYEIKCAGREFCAWTSWWEIFYYMFQSFSMNAFLVAVAYTSLRGKKRRALKTYALVNVLMYNVILFTGAFLPNKFMVSFELFTLITSPAFLILFIINTSNYLRAKSLLELRLMWLWLSQGIIILVYYAYFLSGIAETLWQKGIWFNANDVLHVLIILWQAYIFFFVIKEIQDAETIQK